ncbi:DUF4190 domain-containing protein [Paenibacillus sp. J2TS4]|uniref:DUF4190 domain-containing protein n=1 Tax=Paenibacillus sp. J2TS4 TaxID=2807194 RepID=UPI001AFDD7A6|nr:DUF4190 domain-containing protein [Paenibacillus sp. J2TS4]GIP35813.1 hypothetical protein J2TS4_50230 [Paenibacillus sp. J2TS4]
MSKKKSKLSKEKKMKREDNDFRPDVKDDAEFASEVAPYPVYPVDAKEDDGQVGNETESTPVLGWIGLITAIVSLFFLPAILGPAAAVLGFISFLQGNRTLGAWSIVLGLVSLFVALFLSPFY